MEYIIKDGELYHHGVKGQKWGFRRYQNSDGSLTLLGKARAGYQKHKKKKNLEKARKAKQEKAEAAKKTKQEQEDFEANKKKAIESGSAADVMKYQGKLTNQELQTAVNRINMERSLAEISAKETKSGMDKLDSIMNKVDRARANAEKGISAWNAMAKVLNSTTNLDLPVIDGTKKKDQTEKKAREKLLKSATPEEIKKHFGKLSAKELEEVSKRFNYEDAINKRINERANADNEKAEQNREAARKAWEKISKDREDAARYQRMQDDANARYKSENGSKKETYTGTVVGEGTSKRKTSDKWWKSSGNKTYDDIVTDYVDKSTKNRGSSYVSEYLSSSGNTSVAAASNSSAARVGQTYISGLLPPPKELDK